MNSFMTITMIAYDYVLLDFFSMRFNINSMYQPHKDNHNFFYSFFHSPSWYCINSDTVYLKIKKNNIVFQFNVRIMIHFKQRTVSKSRYFAIKTIIIEENTNNIERQRNFYYEVLKNVYRASQNIKTFQILVTQK